MIATQNPAGSHGTYPLPEAQMDRFALQYSLGYVSAEDEVETLYDKDISLFSALIFGNLKVLFWALL